MSEPNPRPVMKGFTVAWDPLSPTWVATSDSGKFRIHGRDADELMAERWKLYTRLLGEFRQAIAEVFPLAGLG
jgi:hypothetical protein